MTSPDPINLSAPDVSFRALRDLDDAEKIAAICSGCAGRDGIDPFSSLEHIPSTEELRTTVSHALDNRNHDKWLVVEHRGTVMGYCQVLWWTELDGTWVYLSRGQLLPAWRGRGIGSAMLGWAESRARALAAANPNVGKAEFAGNASSTETEATALLRDAGYYVGYTMLELGQILAHALDRPPLPPEISVQPAEPGHYLAIGQSIVDSYRTSRGGGRFATTDSAEEYAHRLSDAGQDPALWQVAWDGGQVVGQVLCQVERGRAEVFEVSVRPAWRRRGIARALLVRALNVLHNRGISTLRLHTNADNPDRARVLYESVGFQVIKQFPRYRKPF